MEAIYYNVYAVFKYDPSDAVVYRVEFKKVSDTGLNGILRVIFEHLNGIMKIEIHEVK